MIVRCCLALAVALSFQPVQGLRTRQIPEAAEKVQASKKRGDSIDTEHEGDDLGGVMPFQAVPTVRVFREKWDEFTRQGLWKWTRTRRGNFTRPTPKRRIDYQTNDLRILVGIFSRFDKTDAKYREVIRYTWMMQKEVCKAAEIGSPPANCKMFVTFVVGNPRRGTAVALDKGGGRPVEETDLTFLDAAENMNCGKTRAWFEHAVRNYPQATHIAKMDMDAYVLAPRFLSVMEELSDDCESAYGGRAWHCELQDACPPSHCGQPTSTDFRGPYQSGDPTCWTYMQGGFYYMTRTLAAEVAAAGGWWDGQSERCLPEDAMAGKAVMHWSRNSTQGVSVVDLVGEHAVWHPDFASYWGARGRPSRRYQPA